LELQKIIVVISLYSCAVDNEAYHGLGGYLLAWSIVMITYLLTNRDRPTMQILH